MSPPPQLAQSIPCPVFLIWGTQDRWYPPVVAKTIARATNSSVTWIDSGHYAMWEKPHEFSSALQNIVQRLNAT